ncbi:hypothetical protein [Corallococcus sp. bb12-1]|uniref:hypothetical protein n=1 Tax=Corallococcus sp. bb12-1 TaxID=2996784 RepID=UPI003B6358B1
MTPGSSHACSLVSGGPGFECWGSDYSNQASPPWGQEFTQVSSGANHTCALTNRGLARCWGDLGSGMPSSP